jgi:hypothetical protein
MNFSKSTSIELSFCHLLRFAGSAIKKKIKFYFFQKLHLYLEQIYQKPTWLPNGTILKKNLWPEVSLK